MKTHHVLVVEDDKELREQIREALNLSHFVVNEAHDGVEALEQVQKKRPDLVLMDVNMPRMDGIECLHKIKEFDPSIVAIIMTAYSNVEDAVRAIKEGAYNYLAKPIKHQAVVEMVERALAATQMIQSMAFSAPIVKMETGEFVGTSSEMRRIFNIIYKLAKVDTSVLIRGESGTGKELVARAIHYNSGRKDEKLVAINCSSIPETLFESELFGHERGAFTGADQRQIGRFQYAAGGTVFLDEIGDLSLPMQVKLLRVLQERKFTPVGSNREIEMNARVIAATNRNLEEMIQKGTFREDLFYRLNVIPIFLPPLRERKDDIEKLAWHFIGKFTKLHSKEIKGISPAAMQVLLQHNWPGNIRELENVIEHSVVIENSDQISPSSLPGYLRGDDFFGTRLVNPLVAMELEETDRVDGAMAPTALLNYKSHKEQFEREFIVKALKTFKGRINQTALHAQIPKKTLLRKLQKYNIRAEDYRA
ncbi:sigma-54 dependent transcriptional regulator [bacterium]|nr:sigma-54 dependent transcriptional regulator [bacterium]